MEEMKLGCGLFTNKPDLMALYVERQDTAYSVDSAKSPYKGKACNHSNAAFVSLFRL